MKTWTKLMIVAPVAATTIVPLTTLTSCTTENHVHYIPLEALDRIWIQGVADKNLKDKLEPHRFPSYFAEEFIKKREEDKEYMLTTFNEAIEGSHYGIDRLNIYDDWDEDKNRATYTVSPSDNEGYESVILFVHGGGYAKNINYIHINGCVELAETLHAKIYIPLHPVSPQHDYRDTYDYINYIYNKMCNDEPNKKIIFMGDSSGGGFVLSYSQYLYNNNAARLPDARVLLSPWVDVSMENTDAYYYIPGDIMLHPFGLTAYGHLWANTKVTGTSVYDYRLSPINGEFEDKIPTMIVGGEKEIFKPDITKLYLKFVQSGCPVEMVWGQELFHDFEFFNDMPAAKKLYAMINNFLQNKPLE